MRSYEGARSLFNFLGTFAWLMVIIGILVAAIGVTTVSRYADDSAALLAALPGIAISIFGLFQIAIVQNARATVDTAEYTQQMLKVSRDQLQVSRQIEKQNNLFQQGYADFRSSTKIPRGIEGFEMGDTAQNNRASFHDTTISTVNSNTNALAEIFEETSFRGRKLGVENHMYLFEGHEFKTLLEAQEHIERIDEAFLAKAPLT